jgi:hypothetical protein
MNTFSGYIEIDFSGERLPFMFGSNAYALFCEKYKIEFWQIAESGIFGSEGKPPDIFKLRELFYFAHVSAMRSRGENPMVNEFRFGDLLDNTEDAVSQLQGAVINAKMLGFTLVELAKGNEVKKK